MKINIFFPFDRYGGGGNQFLKALRNYLIEKEFYENDPYRADVIIFNSHHQLTKLLMIKFFHPEKILIHRIDGPVFKIRGFDVEIDKLIYKYNSFLANGTIFQSQWSKKENEKLGLKQNVPSATITNAPDSKIFYPSNEKKNNEKITLIATSNSANWNKGFELYRYLDHNLDFSKYDFLFIGNSPIKFKNIINPGRVDSKRLADKLRKCDIFITASKNDPCPNSLIEAMCCSLPIVALNSGGHPEIIGKAGELFENEKDILEKIEMVSKNLEYYRNNLPSININKIGKQYHEFIIEIYKNKELRKISSISFLKIIFYTVYIGLEHKFKIFTKKFSP